MSNISQNLRYAIGIAYLLLGGYAIINSQIFAAIQPHWAQFFGALCIIYGAFRLWRAKRESDAS